ncbi:hypothetical protein DB32_006366 [Sandaracinus amylolyticus]|uniref:Uncharacterized protein n=1 Tax=Sandaracinus amylolyticus TaxID=927083 RepID=A0A0F6W7A1_9BACT|nr:hypothetical protein DB32_006366 [Sandaracinus amylolyticus]
MMIHPLDWHSHTHRSCEELRAHEPTPSVSAARRPRRYAVVEPASSCNPTPDVLLGAAGACVRHRSDSMSPSEHRPPRRLRDRTWSNARSRARGAPRRAGDQAPSRNNSATFDAATSRAVLLVVEMPRAFLLLTPCPRGAASPSRSSRFVTGPA